MEEQRIEWIDILKYFGFFFIYIGHFAEAAGRIYNFVFAFHVQLFFFISGCMETLNRETSILKNVKKKFVTLMIPFYFFSLVSLALFAIQYNLSLGDIKPQIFFLLKGIVRNTFIAAYQLWFLPCLFVTHIFFEFIKKIKNVFIMICICLTLFIISVKIPLFRPPKWYYNVDSSLRYIIYFCLGYVIFPIINNLLMFKNRLNKIIVYSTGGISFIYTAFYFFNKDIFKIFVSVPYLSIVIPIIKVLIIIMFFIVLSFICRNISILAVIGKNTLYLCCNEMIVKMIVPSIIGMFGLQVTLGTPLVTIIYTALLLYLANTFMVPAERKVITVINNIFKKVYKNNGNGI
jgi:fucose 4-O-acetylase-like acetyltransferase